MKSIQKQIMVLCSLLWITTALAKNQEVKAEIIGNKAGNLYTVTITNNQGVEISRSTFEKSTSKGWVSKLHFNFEGTPINIIRVYQAVPGNALAQEVTQPQEVRNNFVPKLFKINLNSKPIAIELIGAPKQRPVASPTSSRKKVTL